MKVNKVKHAIIAAFAAVFAFVAPAVAANVAKIGDNYYATLSAAFAAVTDDAQTVTILKDVTENLTGAYLRGNITTENDAKVTITLTNSDWVYCPYTFVLGANVTLKCPALFYYAGGTQINGTLIVGAYYQRYAGTKLTINEPGSMMVTTEQFYLRYTDGDANAGIYINGDNDDSTIGLHTSVIYFYQGMINAKNANIKTSVYWQTNETDSQGSANLMLDNSKLNITSYENVSKATGNSTIILNNGSQIITVLGFEGNASISIDITGMSAGEINAIKGNLANFTGEITAVGNDGLVAEIQNGKLVLVERGLEGSGTEAEPYLINNINDLVLFRDSVNKGETKYNAPGVWVALGADIDMAGAEWTVGIGDGHTYSFDGCFNGNNKTIKNLTLKPYADSENPETAYICGGLFGYTYGAVTIKDLVLENITVTTDAAGHNVGALVGFANNKGGKLNVSGVTVKNVNIDAPNASGVGAIVGYSYREMGAIENCSVDGTAIKGQNFVGGITGYSYSNAQIKNCSVTNVAITATSKFVGGIAGIIGDNTTISGCTATDATVSGTACVGSIVGAISGNGLSLALDNCTVTDTTLPEIGGNYSDDAAVVAKLGNKYYTTFEAAYAAAQAGDTITLLDDVTLTGTLTISKDITIDGNGHSIIANHKYFILETSSDCEFKNITLNTNNKAKGVKIASGNVTFDNVTIPNSNKSDAITVAGTLTIKNYFKVESTYQVFDARSGSIDVEEGTVFDFTSRIGLASPADDNLKAAVDTNGKPYFCAYGSTTYYRTSTSITGTITDLTLLDDVSLNKDITVKGTLDLNGKTLTFVDGKVLKTGGNLTITGGTFAGPVQLTNASHSLTAPEGVNVTKSVAGSRVVYADGKYIVQAINYVAQIGAVKYETFAAALAAAQNDAVVELLWADGDAPIAMNGSVYGKSVTITGTATVDWSKGWLFVGRGGEGDGTVIFDNAKLTSTEASLKNGSYGIHVSASEKGSTTKCNGTVIIRNNSDIQLSYLANRHNVTVDNSRLYVEYGFWVGGRPSGETPDSQPGVANMELVNNSAVTVKNHNGMGVGYESIGNLMIEAGSTFEYLGDEGLMICNAASLVSAGNFFGKINAQENSNIQISGGVYTQNVNEWCVIGYTALPNLNDQYVVGVKPTATVNSFGATTVPAGEYGVWNGSSYTGTSTVDMPLNFVMQFLADQTAADMATSPFADWYGDFVITFTGIETGSFIADGCYLAGYYGDFGWVKIPVDGMKIEEGARYPVMLGVGLGQKYDYICSGVQNFKCALFITPEILEANPNLKVKLELAVVDNSKGSDAAASALVNNEKIMNVVDYTYDVDDFMPVELPEVEVVDIKSSLKDSDPDLTFALNFKIKDMNSLTDEYLEKLFAKYGDYYTDYVLTISGLTDPNGTVTFNANGEADGYLAGQYDAWSKNWVSVPFSDVTIQNNQSLYIMEYAAQLMGKEGLRFTLAEVADIVKDFDCGVYFTPEFLAANPNLKVDLELKVFTEDESGNKVGDISVATNTFDKDDFSVEAAKLDIRIVNGKPQIGFAGEGKLVLNAATALTGEWTKNISYIAVENDGDDAKTWVTPQEGYFFFKGFITK